MYYLASTVRLQPLKLAQKYWKEGGGEKAKTLNGRTKGKRFEFSYCDSRDRSSLEKKNIIFFQIWKKKSCQMAVGNLRRYLVIWIIFVIWRFFLVFWRKNALTLNPLLLLQASVGLLFNLDRTFWSPKKYSVECKEVWRFFWPCKVEFKKIFVCSIPSLHSKKTGNFLCTTNFLNLPEKWQVFVTKVCYSICFER